MTTNVEQVEAWHREWVMTNKPHWGDRIDWATADDIARRLDEAQAPEPASCDLAPAGWYCTRQKGHDGPCAAHPELPLYPEDD